MFKYYYRNFSQLKKNIDEKKRERNYFWKNFASFFFFSVLEEAGVVWKLPYFGTLTDTEIQTGQRQIFHKIWGKNLKTKNTEYDDIKKRNKGHCIFFKVVIIHKSRMFRTTQQSFILWPIFHTGIDQLGFLLGKNFTGSPIAKSLIFSDKYFCSRDHKVNITANPFRGGNHVGYQHSLTHRLPYNLYLLNSLKILISLGLQKTLGQCTAEQDCT